MNKYLLLSLIVALVAVVSAIPLFKARAADEPMPAVGQEAPTFTLPSQDGSPISLDQYRGKWVVLYFLSLIHI